jgi:hypothetical protein
VERYAETIPEVPLFTEAELSEAVGSMRTGSAPEPDGVPTEMLKVVAFLNFSYSAQTDIVA